MLAEPAPHALLLRGNNSGAADRAGLLVLLSYLYCNFARTDGMFAAGMGSLPARAHPTFQYGDHT
jgi:hypothetical protein